MLLPLRRSNDGSHLYSRDPLRIARAMITSFNIVIKWKIWFWSLGAVLTNTSLITVGRSRCKDLQSDISHDSYNLRSFAASGYRAFLSEATAFALKITSFLVSGMFNLRWRIVLQSWRKRGDRERISFVNSRLDSLPQSRSQIIEWLFIFLSWHITNDLHIIHNVIQIHTGCD